MARWALLRHDLTDGTWHYDWMMEGATHAEHDGCGGGLVTFRVAARPDIDGAQVFDAQRLADHRRAYLSYEGEVSGGRGVVHRVTEGTCEIEVDGAIFQVLLIEPGKRWVGTRREPDADCYRFTLQT